jgi:pSer/pThr/pTyr-binding forkhead associated (FHA) protein
VVQVPYLALGGGMGSFVWVDHLRVCGVPEEMIRVVGPYSRPYRRFQFLCANGQIDTDDPLRSASDARPDNLWGFPGYALSAAWREAKRMRLRRAVGHLWQVATEPDLANTFVPRSGQVYRTVDRESVRIGWWRMLIRGSAQWMRKTDDGRFVVAVQDGKGRPLFVVARFVHVALGYGGIRLVPELARLREELDLRSASASNNGHDAGDPRGWVVQAYEPHAALYGELVRGGGTVLIRGRGVTASRVLERLGEIRLHNPSIRVVHLMRTRRPDSVRFKRARRWTRAHRDLQTFNWPKSAWGGEVRRILARTPEAERARVYSVLGGTTTPPARSYVRTVDRGLEEGWYEILFGELATVEKNGQGLVCGIASGTSTVRLPVRALVDATGLDGSPRRHPFLSDLADQYGLAANLSGGLEVDASTFELPGLRNRGGRVFLAGVAASGGAFAPVDSFLGLQVAALGSLDAMRALRAPHLVSLAPWRSLRSWTKWARGRAP